MFGCVAELSLFMKNACSGITEGAQPPPVPGARQVTLGQVPGLAPAKPGSIDGRSSASPSGFTVPLHGSEDGSNVSTHRSSRRLSSVSDRRSTESAEGGNIVPSDPLRRALQQAVALNAVNAHTVNLLSPGGDGSAERQPGGTDETRADGIAGPEAEHVNRMTGGAALQGAAGQQGEDGGSAAGAEDPPAAPPAVAGGGRMASPFGLPAQQSVAQGPESVAEVRERMEPSPSACSSLGGPKLSKVDEVQSSMERSSSDIVATDNQGRQGKSSVLEGIHEQERSQQNSSSSASWSGSGSRSGTRSGSQGGTTRTSSSESAPGGAFPTGQPATSPPRIHPDFLGMSAAGSSSPQSATGTPPAEQGRAAGTAGPGPTVLDCAGGRAGPSPGGDAGAPQQMTPFEKASLAAAESGRSGGSEAAAEGITGVAEGSVASGTSGEQRSTRDSGALGKLWASGKRALGMRGGKRSPPT